MLTPKGTSTRLVPEKEGTEIPIIEKKHDIENIMTINVEHAIHGKAATDIAEAYYISHITEKDRDDITMHAMQCKKTWENNDKCHRVMRHYMK